MSFYGEDGVLKHNRNINWIKQEIKIGTDVNERGRNGNTLLWNIIECYEGPKTKIKVVQLLLENGADTECICENNQTVFFKTIFNDKLREILLEHGADVNAKNDDGNTPLLFADQLEIVKILIEHGADVNVKNNNGDTPLFFANQFEIVKILIKHGADVNAKNNDGNTPLLQAVKYERKFEIAKLLIDSGADVNAKNNDGDMPLFKADEFRIGKLLIDSGADINARNKKGESCIESFLMRKITGCNMKIVMYMMENGVILDPNSQKIEDGLKAIVFKNYPSEYDLYEDEIQSELLKKVDCNYPGLFKACGLNLIGKLYTYKDLGQLGQASTVIIPEDIDQINQGAFINNENIEEVVFHGEVRSIGAKAFYGCVNLRKVTFLNNGIFVIHEGAFSKCSKLQSISIVNGTLIGAQSFKDCTALKEIKFVASDERWQKHSDAYKEYYGNPKHMWQKEAFMNCIELTELKEFWVTSIGKRCFLNCKNLHTVEGVIYKCDDYAFWGCDSLKQFRATSNEPEYSVPPWDIPKQELGKYVFPFNEYEDFKFYDGVIFIDSQGFELYPETVKKVLKVKPYRYEEPDDDFEQRSDYREDDYSWDTDAWESTPDYWDNLYSQADKFYEPLEDENPVSKSVKEKIVTDSQEKIPRDTEILRYASNITTIGLTSDGLYKLKFVYFDDIDKITDFTVKKKLDEPDEFLDKTDEFIEVRDDDIIETFYGTTEEERCTFSKSNIEAIEIPPNIKDVSLGFGYNSNLKNVVFSSRCKTENLYYAFAETGIEQCKLPSTVVELKSAFSDCKNLTKVEFWKEPDALKELDSTFSGCTRLKEFQLPASVESLYWTFKNCLSLENVVFPKDSRLKKIGSETFYNCVSLRKIIIPESVETIGSRAFKDCISLEEVYIMGEPQFEGSVEKSFEGCILLKKVAYQRN